MLIITRPILVILALFDNFICIIAVILVLVLQLLYVQIGLRRVDLKGVFYFNWLSHAVSADYRRKYRIRCLLLYLVDHIAICLETR